MRSGGTAPAVLNGANEEAVQAFLEDRICFGRITQVVREALERAPVVSNPTLEQVFEADLQARRIARDLIG